MHQYCGSVHILLFLSKGCGDHTVDATKETIYAEETRLAREMLAVMTKLYCTFTTRSHIPTNNITGKNNSRKK